MLFWANIIVDRRLVFPNEEKNIRKPGSREKFQENSLQQKV